MRLASRAAFSVLLLLPNVSFAADTEAALLGQIRATAQQYDRIADGSSSPPLDLSQLRERYRDYLREAAAAGAKSQTIREMAEIFVLMGGDSAILKPWGEGLESGSLEKRFFDGLIAYGEGRTPEAEANLLPLDGAALDPVRGGHLSLAQALIAARHDPIRAFGYFETAALLLPGTLVEEASLRQISVLAARTGDARKFSEAAVSYFRRFPRSAHVAGFETQVSFQIARFPGPEGLAVLQDILRAVPEGWGRCLDCFLASVAEQAVLMGKAGLASAAVEAALPHAAKDSPERQRLLLFSGSAAIVTDKFAKGLEALQAVQEEKLSWEDRELLRASLTLAVKLRETPVMLNPLKPDGPASPPRENRVFSAGGRRDAAKLALKNADAVLKNGK